MFCVVPSLTHVGFAVCGMSQTRTEKQCLERLRWGISTVSTNCYSQKCHEVFFSATFSVSARLCVFSFYFFKMQFLNKQFCFSFSTKKVFHPCFLNLNTEMRSLSSPLALFSYGCFLPCIPQRVFTYCSKL